MARNAEFNFDRFALSNMDNSECKENDLPELAEALHLPERFSLLFSETKRTKPQRCTWEGHLKNKRKINATINVNPVGVSKGWGFDREINFLGGRFDRVPLFRGRDV